jgi:hypothetical protein
MTSQYLPFLPCSRDPYFPHDFCTCMAASQQIEYPFCWHDAGYGYLAVLLSDGFHEPEPGSGTLLG